MTIHDILDQLAQSQGSDVHIVVGSPPILRIDGKLVPVPSAPVLSAEMAEQLIVPVMTAEQQEIVQQKKEFDFGYQFRDVGRFRVNVYYAMGNLAACFRLIPARIKTLPELSLPPQLERLANYRQGLVLLTGPTGEGKSTTLAAIINQINQMRAEHILTIEDPIEFVHQPIKSLISQREMNQDTIGWKIALRSALREDPDVVLVGEMRDFETISSAITVAETGHLVFATLHTSTAAQTMDRIIDVFPAAQQSQIRQQLASSVKAVVSQRLLPRVGGGRVPACEILFANSAVRNLVREGKTYQLDNVMQTSAQVGMMLFETHLNELIGQGLISVESARDFAFRPNELDRLLGGG